MLILSRRINEKIIIGDDIVVSVVEVRGDQVKLGIDAPRNVKVFRQEVFNAIQEENRKAAAASGMQLPEIDIPERLKP
jgi:carbon storage regulator